MNNKGFTLVELLISLVVLGAILGIGLYMARGTLATTADIISGVSESEIYNAAEMYVLENGTNWINNGEEYTCVSVLELVDKGYFENDKVNGYKDKKIRIERNPVSKVISDVEFVDVCE